MDRTAPAPPQHRDIVYCHQCENEWYRDEHGMVPCPECGGDFTEVVEEGNDPRDVPDPEEEDIGHFEWRNNPQVPGQFHGQGTYTRNINITNVGGLQPMQPGGGLGGGGLFGLIGGAVQSALGGAQAARTMQQGQQRGQGSDDAQGAQGQQPGTFVRHTEGPGYSFTIRSNVNLHPRNANGPQLEQAHPDDLDRVLASVFANIGAQPGGPGHFRFGPPPFGGDDDFGGGRDQIGNMLRAFGMPIGGVHGDAVYSQEAFDRIVTQMMEQNASGNAPGPASQQAIDTLPKKSISQSDLDEQGKAECTICMDEVPVGEEVTVLPCEHWFHFDCIKMWLTEHDTCPHCRRGIMPEGQPAGNQARSSNQAPLNNMHSPEYQAPRVPGSFPFLGSAAANDSATAEGSQQNPINIPESPQQERRTSAGGVFSRLRDTIGGGGSSSAGGSKSDRRSR